MNRSERPGAEPAAAEGAKAAAGVTESARPGRKLPGWWRLLPAAIWMGVIFWLSSRTGSELGSLFPFADRLPRWMGGFDFGHLVAYYILGWLVLWGFGHPTPRAKWLTVGICTLYGATDEFHQLFVDGRSAELHDLVNDAIGACLAVLTASLPPVRRRFGGGKDGRSGGRAMG